MFTHRKKPQLAALLEVTETLQHPMLSRQDGKIFVYNQMHNAHNEVNIGDYINVTDDPRDVYPVARKFVEANFERLDA